MKISEVISMLSEVLKADGDIEVYVATEDTSMLDEEPANEILWGKKRVTITSRDFS